jgi:hypothetical protein
MGSQSVRACQNNLPVLQKSFPPAEWKSTSCYHAAQGKERQIVCKSSATDLVGVLLKGGDDVIQL